MIGSRRRRRQLRGAELEAALARRRRWLVVLATLVAAGLRLLELGSWSFWVDESHTFRDATMPLYGENGFFSTNRSYYPLTFLMLRALIDGGLVGHDELALRLPFAVVGIVTVPVLWACGRAIVGERAAVLSAWLLALMPWHVFWSQSARGYVFLLLSSIVVAALLWRWHIGRRRRDLWLAVLVGVLGYLFHPTAAMQFVGFGLFVLLRGRNPSPWVLAIGALVLLVLLAAAPSLLELLFPEFARSKAGRTSFTHFVTTSGYYFRPLVLVAAVAGFALLRRDGEPARVAFFGCLAATPFVLLFEVGMTVAQTTARYALCTLPLILWLAAHGAVRVGDLLTNDGNAARAEDGSRAATRVAGAFVAVLLLADLGVGAFQYFAHHHGERARWHEAAAFLEREFADDNLYVVTTNEPTVRYYLTPDYWQNDRLEDPRRIVRIIEDFMLDGELQGNRLHEPGAAEHLRWRRAEAKAAGARFVIAGTMPMLQSVDPSGDLLRRLRSDFRLALHLPCWIGPKDESIFVYVDTAP